MAKTTTENPIFESMEAPRRFVEQTMAATRQTTERGIGMTRQLTNIWVAGAESGLKATIDLQNSTIATGRSLVEATGINPSLYDQWAKLVHQAQQITLDAWQNGKRISEEFQAPK